MTDQESEPGRKHNTEQVTETELIVIQACQLALREHNATSRSAKFSRVMTDRMLGPDECLKAIDRRLHRSAKKDSEDAAGL
jgi:hypothetical protein